MENRETNNLLKIIVAIMLVGPASFMAGLEAIFIAGVVLFVPWLIGGIWWTKNERRKQELQAQRDEVAKREDFQRRCAEYAAKKAAAVPTTEQPKPATKDYKGKWPSLA